MFLDDNWQEDAPFLEPVRGAGLDSLINDPLLPEAARDAENWLRQEVTIEALQDSHLVGASVPVAYEEARGGDYGSGIAYVGRLERDQTYSVWSYAAQPTPAQLARSRPVYPEAILVDSPFLGVGNFYTAPPFGSAEREPVLRQMFDQDEEQAQYEPLYRQARQVVGRPRNPYAAAVALEAWFRSSGEFSYDESPPVREGSPPLVSFVTATRRGYCQHFAGAMALMLRYLGIPARVAAGFTTGLFDEDEGRWTVADTNAHTWVEVWFDGFGWLPFDPTPGRGRLRAEYTASSLFFDASGATAAFAGGAAALGLDILRNRLGGASPSPDDRDRLRGPDTGIVPGSDAAATTQAAEERDDVRLLAILLGSAAALLAAFWLLKWGRRRVRYLSDDPRRIAGAVRAELEDYLADQRVGLPRSATPAELSETVHRRLRVDADRLADALGQARFGPADEAERAARIARRELRGVLRTMRRRLGARRRLRGFGLPPLARPALRLTRGASSTLRTEMSETYDLFQQGRSHLRKGRAAQATVALEKAKKREPDKASIREALGIAYFRIQRYDEAEREFRAMLELAPTDDYAHYALGRSLEKLGREQEANGHYKLASSLRPGSEQYAERIKDLG